MRHKLHLVLLLALIGFALYVCFWNLGQPSIASSDESIHSHVVQEMIATGRWFFPTLDGGPYFSKPPFKLILSKLAVLALGDSSLAYRFVDGLAGFLTIVLTFLLGLKLFSSFAAGWLAALMLASCPIYLFRHVVREAVQDSMLVFLTSAALFAGWQSIAPPQSPDAAKARTGITASAALFGVLSGLAVLTKSVAGLLPLLVWTAALAAQGRLNGLWRENKAALLAPVVLAGALAALYYAPRFLLAGDAARQIVYVDLYQRLVGEGYHHKGQWWFYFNLIFLNGKVVPPGMLLLGLAAAGCFFRQAHYQFLLIWVALPILGYSALSSHLPWYIAPAFPAMALLSAGAMIDTLKICRRAMRPPRHAVRSAGAALAAAGLCVYSAWAIGANLHEVSRRVSRAGGKISLEKIVREIRASLQRAERPGKVVFYRLREHPSQPQALSHQKKFYLNMLLPYAVRAGEETELARIARTGELAFAVSYERHRDEIAASVLPCAEKVIRVKPSKDEPEEAPASNLIIMAFHDCAELKEFAPFAGGGAHSSSPPPPRAPPKKPRRRPPLGMS